MLLINQCTQKVVSPLNSIGSLKSTNWTHHLGPLCPAVGQSPMVWLKNLLLRTDEVHSSGWKLVYKCNQSSVPEKNIIASRDNRMRNLHQIIPKGWPKQAWQEKYPGHHWCFFKMYNCHHDTKTKGLDCGNGSTWQVVLYIWDSIINW